VSDETDEAPGYVYFDQPVPKIKLSEKKRKRLLQLIAAGNYQQTAYRAAGISQFTFYDWRKKGYAAREDRASGISLTPIQEEYLDFVNQLDDARAQAEATLVARWYTEAADGDWRAAERFLAKAFPERWSDPATRLEITGAHGGPVQQLNAHVNVTNELDGDRQRKVLEALVDAGDLPSNVLDAWDGETGDDDEGPIGDADGVEEAVLVDPPPRPASEAASVPVVDDD